MVDLKAEQISYLRKTYEKLDSAYQRAIYVRDPRLQQITAEEFRRLFEMNSADSERWPTFTDLESHIKNVATVRSMGGKPSIY